MYYLITYSWSREAGKSNVAMECYKGTVAEWVMEAMETSDNSSLLNAHPLTATEYLLLKDQVS